jgi:integrating conjugative element relaxase (TIGR03760 family)
MSLKAWLDLALVLVSMALGALVVHRYSKRPRRYRPASAAAAAPVKRPAAQLPVRSYEELLQVTSTASLVASVERRTRLSRGNWERDCEPALRAFAEFVQCLPASECHHHAQPGGLWVHALEVVDAALTFRAGAELPAGVSTEDRKRLEHRWTYGVFAAALLHDVGKPVTDVRVTLYGQDPRLGQRWTPLSGSMRACGAHWYTVAFDDPAQREYQAHSKLPAMLLQSFVPAHVLRWLGEDGDVLDALVAYLMGDAADGALGAIVKRADSDSVRRNLLQGPRTRFASARSVPLIERLMQALKRMVIEGGQLPLNRPGAAGWVYDGHVWFVCARLADEVRSYMATHESTQGVPGKDRNDRLFDTWQEYGAARTAPDGGAIWRVRVECDGWSPPDPLTVLCFALGQVYEAGREPAAMNGRIVSLSQATGTLAGPGPVAVPTSPAAGTPSALADPGGGPGAVATSNPEPASDARQNANVPVPSPQVSSQGLAPGSGATAPIASLTPMVALQPRRSDSSTDAATSVAPSVAPAVERSPAGPSGPVDDDRLDPAETATLSLASPITQTPELGSPLRPKPKGREPALSIAPTIAGGSVQRRTPTPAATAFMAWVAQSVGSGDLAYNQEGAMVHFCDRGALLLSPEIFRRFFAACEGVSEGPIAALVASHGDRAFARLQNELAKSGWTVRNGDENLHYYTFTKADGKPSRTASFYLIDKPQLFWNPVPAANDRIRAAARPKKMALPASATAAKGASVPHLGRESA